MHLIEGLFSFILHIDQHLIDIIQMFGGWSYAILFLIIFVETGLVVFPFLPGDSLLFASAALAAAGEAFNIWPLVIGFLVAAIIGDSVNYQIGKSAGKGLSATRWFGKFISQDKLEAAERFFNKHGGKTIVIARFMPFIRTFAPFVAGASRMDYRYFLMYNIAGAVLWVGLCTSLGFLFGNIPVVKENFSAVLLFIIALSVVPPLVSLVKNKFSSKPA
ncbi:VTT domain-containing protein [Sporosarcina koreensis]|uniref:VTT domain-containing protein n=1 Tax=Sporosarcina koreensis TaxID=334735 RepID=UPI00058D4DA4|nr:VTT domain-containing protein [Sporosarcina koreensis]